MQATTSQRQLRRRLLLAALAAPVVPLTGCASASSTGKLLVDGVGRTTSLLVLVDDTLRYTSSSLNREASQPYELLRHADAIAAGVQPVFMANGIDAVGEKVSRRDRLPADVARRLTVLIRPTSSRTSTQLLVANFGYSFAVFDPVRRTTVWQGTAELTECKGPMGGLNNVRNEVLSVLLKELATVGLIPEAAKNPIIPKDAS
jgi:hypothetical protein